MDARPVSAEAVIGRLRRTILNTSVLRNLVKIISRICRPHLPILLATLIVAGLCVFGEPLYQSNDDVGLAMLGAGFGEAVKPTPYLIWSHFGYGLILKGLSHLVGPNAHGWVTIFSIWLSLALIIRVSFDAASWWVRLSVLVVCFGCVYVIALLAAEFTITASVLFGAALAHWLVSLGQDRPQSRLWVSARIAAFLLSYLIRPESYIMGLAIAAPTIFFLCWRRDKIGVRVRVLASGLALIVVLGWSEKIVYWSSPAWRHVPEHMDLLNQFAMYNRVPWSPQAPEYRQAGWTGNDYDIFCEWFTLDPIYNLDNLSLLVKKLAVPVNVSDQIGAWFRFPFGSRYLMLALCAQFIVCLVLDHVQRPLGILLILGEFAAIAAAALTGRDPLDYVWEAAAALTLLSLSALLIVNSPRNRFLANLGSPVVGLLGLFAAALVYSHHLRVCHQAAEYRHWINQNRELLYGKVTVWGSGLTWEWLVTPTRIYPPFPELKVAVIDDLGCTPVEADMLRSLKVDNLAKALGTDPDMRLICPVEYTELLARFCEEHFGVSPVFKEVARWEESAIYVLDQQNTQKQPAQE